MKVQKSRKENGNISRYRVPQIFKKYLAWQKVIYREERAILSNGSYPLPRMMYLGLNLHSNGSFARTVDIEAIDGDAVGCHSARVETQAARSGEDGQSVAAEL